jgi:hypothetical protein
MQQNSGMKIFQFLRTIQSVTVAALSLILLITITPSASADVYNPVATVIANDELLNYVVEDGSVERNSYIAIMPPAITAVGETRAGKWKWCLGLNDPVCDPKSNPVNMKATSILGPCMSATDENCIESLEVGSGTNLERATLIRVTSGLTFPAAPEYDYPGSSNISLWKTASGANPFAVMPRMQLYFRNGSFSVGELFADVVPYKEKTGNYAQIKINTRPDATPENRYDFARNAQSCVFEEDGVCGVAQEYEADTRIKLKLRIANSVGGWFRGRMKDPVLDVANFSAKNNLITVEATPVTVPRMAVVVKPAAFGDQEKVWFQNNGQWPLVAGGAGSGPQAGIPQDSFPFIEFYRERVKDKTTGVSSFWNFNTTSWGDGSKCLQDKSKVLGIVTTNSLAYDGGSPSFVDGSLNYRVSGLHFMPDGVTPVLGTYNLVMKSEVARCLYGFSSAPISASVSIVGGESAIVATTVTGERNGWLSLSAAGFTFSTKTIRVKLSQEAPAVAAPPVKTVVKKTIKCVKGKTVKKVTAVSPKCPSGFKVAK